jgi:hypothetical protein
MRRRIARRLRGIVEAADKSIRMLEIEKNAIDLETSQGSEELATIERVLAKLEELALTIEFELHLRQTAVPTQMASALEVQVEKPLEEFLAMSTQTPSAFEARVERYFREATGASTHMPSELDTRVERSLEEGTRSSTRTPSAFEARVERYFREIAEDRDA